MSKANGEANRLFEDISEQARQLTNSALGDYHTESELRAYLMGQVFLLGDVVAILRAQLVAYPHLVSEKLVDVLQDVEKITNVIMRDLSAPLREN